MKKQFLFLSIAVLFSTIILSQNPWVQIHPYPTAQDYYDTFFVNEQKGYIVGKKGLIMFTDDGGTTWEKQYENEDRQFKSVFFIDENEGWVAGWGQIYHTINGGEYWEMQDRPIIFGDLQDIFFINQDTGWVVGSYKIILKTTDGGENWVKVMNSTVSQMNFVSVYFTDAIHGCAVGGTSSGQDEAITMVTEDGGNTWIDTSPDDIHKLNSVYFINQDTGFACGFRETILKTNDGGSTWSLKHNDPIGGFLNEIYLFDDLNGMALSGNHNFFTEDGGNNWTEQYQVMGGTTHIEGFDAFNDSAGFAVGAWGRIVKTTNMGNDWERIDNSTSHPYYGIGFFDELNGLAILEPTYDNHIMMTNDGGYSWFEKQINVGSNLYDISLPSVTVGYLLANKNDKLVKTINGGHDWTILNLPETIDGYYNTIQFLDEQIGYVCGTYGQIFKTTDGGLTWNDKSISSQPFLRGMSFINENEGWLIDYYGKVIKTTTGGSSYSFQTLEDNNITYTPISIFFVNNLVGYITTNEGAIFKTIDSGDQWDVVFSFSDGEYSNIYFLDENRGWYKSHYGIYYTDNGGESWDLQMDYGFGGALYEIFFLDEENGWFSGVNSIVSKYVSPVSIDEVKEQNEHITIYPNPTNDELLLSTILPVDKISRYEIYDINGRMLVSSNILQNTKIISIDISKLKTGIYVIKAQVNRHYSFSKFVKN